MNIHKIKKNNESSLLELDGVVAVGIGHKVSNGKQIPGLAIIVTVEKKQPALALAPSEVIPSDLNGVATDVVDSKGPIKKFENDVYARPAQGGLSIGHEDITCGTFGCVVQKDGKQFILSNNHVLANSNAGEIGDPILQPGPYDGGTMAQQIGTLHDYVPILFAEDEDPAPPELPSECNIAKAITGYFNTTAALFGRKTRLRAVTPNQASPQAETDNYVDCALCEPSSEDDIAKYILEIGIPVGVNEGILDMPLQKSGRTTEYTTDVVLQVDVTVDVQYGEGKIARFVDQIVAGPMSAGGDSGSAVLDGDCNVVGLLFAGSEEFTVINHIKHVFDKLGVTL